MKGRILKGVVTGIENYGVFVQFDDYYTGLIHISEISDGFVKNITDYVSVGEIINAKIIDVDDNMGHLKLSIKNIQYKEKEKIKRKKIKETSLGFRTLEYKLPFWIEKNLKNHKKNLKTIDNEAIN